MGGVAFAPDGDVWVTNCAFANGNLRRFDLQATSIVSGSTVHTLVGTTGSNTGCGLTNNPDGNMYSNTNQGVTRQDASTGLPAGGPFGPGGNALGIATHPVTGNLFYVGSGGDINEVDAAFTTSSVFSTAIQGAFIDGIFFDPTGNFLFCANRTIDAVSIIDSSGALVQNIALGHEPDGIAFRAASPQFVVTINLDGTMSRLDFPTNDFTQAPSVSEFASGGFRGDLSQVGPDGCLYLTQDSTRFADGTVSFNNSIVRICSGFAPPSGVGNISLGPISSTCPTGQSHSVTATVTQTPGPVPVVGTTVTFTVLTGPNTGVTGMVTTDSNGMATFSYAGSMAGVDTIQASFVDGSSGMPSVSNVVSKTWTVPVTPTCVAPTPSLELNNGTQTVMIGSPISHPVIAQASHGGVGQTVTITGVTVERTPSQTTCAAAFSATTFPSNATLNSPIPVTGQPASLTFDWTPDNSQISCWRFTYELVDDLGVTGSCTIEIEVVECFLIIGLEAAMTPIGGDMLLVNPLLVKPMTLANLPTLEIPNIQALVGYRVFVQAALYNPEVFPNDYLKFSHGLEFEIGGGVDSYGSASGLTVSAIGNGVGPGDTLSVNFGIAGF